MASTSQATENNQKLFRRYRKMFALSDPHIYTSHAEKLSLWLNDFKAYYTAARPEIVKLLLIAQMTLRKALGLVEHLDSPFNILEFSEHPMAKSYIKLVKTVEPFENHFTEPGLLVHIKSMLASVSPLHTSGGTHQPITHFQAGIQSHSHVSETSTSPSYVSETQITEPSSNTMAISAPNFFPVVAKAQVKGKKRKAVDFNLLVQRDIKALLEKQGIQGQSIQGHSSQHITEDSMMSPNSLGDPPPSEKTGPLIDVSAQTACEDQKISAPDQITESLPSQDTTVATEAQGSSSPACEDQKMAAPDQTVELLPSQDTSVAAEAQGSPSPACEDQILAAPDQITESLPSQDTNAAAEGQGSFSPFCEDRISAPDQIIDPLLSHDTSAAAKSQESSSPACEDQTMTAPDQITDPLSSYDRRALAEARATSPQAVIEDEEMAPPDSVMEFLTLQKATEPSQTVTEDQEMEAANTIDLSLPSEDVGAATKPQASSCQIVTEEQETAAGDSGDSGLLLSQKTNAAIETQESAVMLVDQECVTASLQSPQGKTKNLTPLVTSGQIENIPPVQDLRSFILPTFADNMIKSSPRGTMAGNFEQEMRIVAVGKGLNKECTVAFTFPISDSLFPKVSGWLNWNVSSLNIEQSLCLSLGCYSIADLQEQSTKNKYTTLEQQTSVARSYWPQRGGLSMNVQLKNRREDLPLSPPLQVTPDGFVDVSQFLLVGNNIIKLNLTANMSQYIFILHSHYPTRAQLQEVDRRRQKDREWQEWVRHVSRPFDIPLKPTLQT